MTFDEVLTQVIALLREEQRVSYRGLKRRFALDDEYLEDLKEELIGAKRLAIDEDGRFLMWVGNSSPESEKVQGSRSTVQSQEIQSPTPSPQPLAERRQLTVMFIDLVGSTTLSQQLDPEDYHARVQAYQSVCSQVITRYEGYIAQYLGDGVLGYFSYPAAHEDDAVRAVRAGLEIISAIQEQVPSPLVGEHVLRASEGGQGEGTSGKERKLQVRIGIHTGPVVVAEIGSSEKREMLALGETPNIAARIQGTANPNEVVISTATYRLIEGLFATEERGKPELKGVATPLTLYRVSKESDAHSRFEVVVRKGLTPLIGREHEIGLLRERWEQVKDGTGQIVLLNGEPGIGKSRLVEALKETVEREGARCLELRCSPYTQNSALQPVIEYLQRVLKFQSEDSTEEKLYKLVGATHASSLHEHVPLFAALLSLPHPEGFPALTLSPQKQKEKTHEALVAWMCAEAKQHPMTYAWEDLHWADPSTLELLTLFLEQVPTTRLLAVFTYRPEFLPPWGAHSYFSQINLSRLGRQQVREMVNHVAEQAVRTSTGSARTGNLFSFASDSVRPELVEGRVALSDDLINAVIVRTDGVPLFVEELTKSVVESVGATGRSPLQSLDIPSTLQDSLMARLDRLGTAKEIAQLGATLGREFAYELLHAVSPLPEETLQQSLRQLVESELVYQSGIPPQARYLFKHALVQDTAYQSLLKSRRQQYHQQIAQVLDERFLETKETQPELLAHHYTAAGLIAQAIPYWQRAGERATQRSANVEAIAHLSKGLELLKILPDIHERAQQELTLQLALGVPLMATKSWSAPEVKRVYARARELCLQVGETPQLFPVLFGLWIFYTARAEHKAALELVEQCFTLAQSIQDPGFLLEAHLALRVNLFHLGNLVPSREHLEQGLAFYDPQQHRSHAFLYGYDPGVWSLVFAAWALWYIGYPDQALKRNQEALTLAQEISHPFSLGYASFFAAALYQFRREARPTQERADAAITFSIDQGFPELLVLGTLLRGWALAEQRQGTEGLTLIHQSLAADRAIGVELFRPYHLALLAEAYSKAGQLEEGLIALDEALVAVNKTEERRYEAELYRLYGELSVRAGKMANGRIGEKSEVAPSPDLPVALSSPEACFLKAIDIARKQQAKSLELRAATSLARLWQQQGKKTEAHKLLAEVYNWFTEGFDTKDLQEAKTLLEELSH